MCVCVSTPITSEVFDYAKGYYVGLSEYLLGCEPSSLYKSSNVEEIWYLLRSHIISAMDLFIPKKHYTFDYFLSGLHPSCATLVSVFACSLQCKFNENPSPNYLQRLSYALQSFHMVPILLQSLCMNRV